MPTVVMKCPICKENTPHRAVWEKDAHGRGTVQRHVCSKCGSSQSISTGAHGETYQENVDCPDDTEADPAPEASQEKVRVNWHQAQAASDGLLRAHQVLTAQPTECQFFDMNDFKDYDDESTAQAAMRQRGITKYKRCAHCWDGEVIHLT